MQGKQAKMVSPTQERAILGYLATTRYPARDQVMFLLSIKAGLRAKAMASLTWAMVTDATGRVAEVLHVPNRARKGKTGSRRDSGRAGDCAGGGGGDFCGGVNPGAALGARCFRPWRAPVCGHNGQTPSLRMSDWLRAVRDVRLTRQQPWYFPSLRGFRIEFAYQSGSYGLKLCGQLGVYL